MTDQPTEVLAGRDHPAITANTYLWPGWDKSLGAPPVIAIEGQPDKAYLDAFKQVLTNIADLSHAKDADALRKQLRELSGVPINIHAAQGEAIKDREPNTTPPKGPDQPPFIHYSPDLWGRYPVKGSQETEAAHWSLPDLDKPLSEWRASMRHSAKYSEYGISPPEQLFLHELGHYVHFHHAHQLFVKSHAENQNPMNPGSYFHQALEIIQQGRDESYITNIYENPSMKSVNPEFRERGDLHYKGGSSFLEGKGGVPAVGEEDRKALQNALKVHPVKEESQGAKLLNPQSKVEMLAPEFQLAAMAAHINTGPFTEEERSHLYVRLAENANKAGFAIGEMQAKEPERAQG